MRGWVALAFLIVLASAVAVRHYTTAPTQWANPDSVFYQAQLLSLRGEETSPAAVYNSPLGASARFFFERTDREVNDAGRFYERRLLVPAIGALLYPVADDRSLQVASLIGYVLVGVALFLLLRLRFEVWVAAAVAAVVVLAPPVRDTGFLPMTDSWGLALQALTFLFAVCALKGDRRWLAALFVASLALALSRDNGLALAMATGWIALTDRTRRALAVVAVIAAGTFLPPLVSRVSAVDYLAWTLNGFREIQHDRVGFIAEHWPDATWERLTWLATGYWDTPAHVGTMLLAIAALAGLAMTDRQDVYFRIARAGIVGGLAVIVLAAAPPGGFRIELVFVPFLAVGLARLAQAAALRLAAATRAPPAASARGR
jgi:hypothetical protein